MLILFYFFYGTAYKMNSTELELEVCHQKSYASWHGSMVYSLFRIFEKVSIGTYYWLFSSARTLSLISLFILFVTSKSIGLLIALQKMILSCSLF